MTFSKNNEMILNEKYLIITDLYLIICSSINEKNKTRVIIDFYSLLNNIENIIDFNTENKNKENLSCFELTWEKNSPSKYSYSICTEPEERREIMDLLITRKIKLISKFKYFYYEQMNDIEDLKKVSEIKEKIFSKFNDETTFNSLSFIYQKIIELYSMKNDDGYQPYMNKLKNLIINYDNTQKGK